MENFNINSLRGKISECLHLRLEFLRGLAALFVLFDHTYSAYLERLFGVNHFQSLFMQFLGSHAVIIFFLLSGFLILSSCYNNIYRHGFFNISLYLKSRTKRIYPPLLISIAVSIFLSAIIDYFQFPGSSSVPYGLNTDKFSIRRYFSIDFMDIIYSISFNGGMLTVNGPLWSLNIEVRLYILVMFFFIFFSPSQTQISYLFNIAIKWTACIIFVMLCFFFICNSLSSFHIIYYLIWCIGAVSFYLYKSIYAELIRKVATHLFFLLLFLNILMSITVYDYLNVGSPNDLVRETSKLLFSMMYTIGIFFINTDAKGRNIFRPIITLCARISYSLYVIHFPLLLFGISIFQNWMGDSIFNSTIVCFSMVIFIIFNSYLISLFVERSCYNLYR